MEDSNVPERRDAKRELRTRHRIDGVKRWVEYIQEQPPEVWGEQQNRLIDSQLQSARAIGLDAEHYRRLDNADKLRKRK